MMRLRVILPSQVFMDEQVVSMTGESPMGGFTLRPRHIDMVTTIEPSILSYRTKGNQTVYLAVDRGVVVKQGDIVSVSARHAVRGELGELEQQVRDMLEVTSERERSARTAVARLEADFVRRFLEFGP